MFFPSPHPRSQRFTRMMVVLFFVFSLHAGVLLYAQPAQAQDAVPTETKLDLPRKLSEEASALKEKAKTVAKKVSANSVSQAFYRIVMNFSARLTATLGKALAEGGHGGKPLFDSRQLKDAVNEAGDAALGDALDELGKGIGFNLCLPPEIRLNIGLGLWKTIEPDKPQCTFSQLRNNWRNFANDPNFLQRLNLSLDPSTSETGLALRAIIDAESKQSEKEEEERLDRIINKGFKGVEEGLSHDVKLPAQVIENFVKTYYTPGKPDENPKLTGDLPTDAPAIGIYNFVAAFTNTAFERLLKEGLFKAQPRAPRTRPAFFGLGSGGTSSAGTPDAPSVATVQFAQTGAELDLLAEFTSCPDQGKNIYSCVLEQNFADAIRQGITVQEAIDKGLLRKDWPFGFGGASGDETVAYDRGYGYENMKKLRRARIIPIGWELAAEVIRASRLANTTLATVVANFNQSTSPFYHLVDPNWVLKAPLYSCRAKGAGALLQLGTADRLDYCADIQDCVVPTADGSGCQSWGYCTREQNTWRFGGQSCQPQFNSCTSYTRTDTNAQFAFNRNTVDRCSADAVGCAWYATTQSADKTQWQTRDKLFFNRNVASCTLDAAGCSQFLKITGLDNGVSVDKTVERFNAVQQAALGTSYDRVDLTVAKVHLKGSRIDCRGGTGETEDANVGCELYTPKTVGDPNIPAVVSAQDQCAPSCVGYDTFKEVATNFTPERFVQFIPASGARSCSAPAAGCEEFTNLDKVAAGGEAREYYTFLRQCQKPSDDAKTYFTWVGTETTGYQLQTHTLKASQLDRGRAPCTNRDLSTSTCVDPRVETENAGVCTKADMATNPDCREFYDELGAITYRLLSHTIIADAACIRYRRTAALERDCASSGGAWDGATNACNYLAFPKENRSCTADAVGCRAYKGNTANDVRVVVNESFEGASRPNTWSAGEQVTESTVASAHSLKVTGATTLTVAPADISALKTYLVEFWARGPGELSVTLAGGRESYAATPQTLRTNWAAYTAGPFFVSSWTENTAGTLTWSIPGSAVFYLDAVRVKEVRDNFYFIKDSWTTPSQCTARDIGCRAYTDRKGTTQTLRQFGHLCKQEFVGCTNFIDTKNSSSPFREQFQNTIGTPADDVVVPADTIAYLVDDPKYYCVAENKGCTAVGAPVTITDTAPFAVTERTRYLKNDPDQYVARGESQGSILCIEPNIGCNAYRTSGGGEEYFKDPGAKTCEWKQWPETTEQKFGWFKKGSAAKIPDCGDPTPDGATTPAGFVRSCPASEDRCTAFFDPRAATKPYYIIDNDRIQEQRRAARSIVSEKFGNILFQNTSKRDTNGAVTALYNADMTYKISNADPAFKAISPIACAPGKSYCVNGANNGKQCAGDGAEVSATQCTTDGGSCTACAANDTNDIVHVERDRVCGEWLSCISGTQVYDRATQAVRNVCSAVGSCTQASPYNATQCAQMKDPDTNAALLDLALYQSRNTSWGGNEFSGNSIPYRYPITSLQQVPYTFDATTREPIAFRLSNFAPMIVSGALRVCANDAECSDTAQPDPTRKCIFKGQSFSTVGTGVCYKDRGIGTTFTAVTEAAIEKSCRLYPSSDAPFPQSVVEAWQKTNEGTQQTPLEGGDTAFDTPQKKIAGFEQVNVESRFPATRDIPPSPYTYASADCSYRRIRYKDGETRFFGIDGSYPHAVDNAKETDIRLEQGLKGFCLERDTSLSINGDRNQSPCLTWFPSDLIAGEVDVNASFPEAEYRVASDRQLYCVASEKQEKRVSTSFSGCECPYGYEPDIAAMGGKGCLSTGGNQIICRPVPVQVDSWYPEDPAIEDTGEQRTICSQFIEIADNATNANFAWTERILGPQSAVWPRPYQIPDLGYAVAVDAKPFGAVNPGQAVIVPGKPFGVCQGGTSGVTLCDSETSTAQCKQGQGVCGPLVVQSQAPHAGAPYGRVGETMQTAIDRLKQIFARGFGLWQKIIVNGDTIYTPSQAATQTWDYTGTNNPEARGPAVHAATYTPTTQTYRDVKSGITIDTRDSGTIEFPGTAQAVALKFYAYNKNGNQMPLRRVAVDWGDGTDFSVSKGSLKNHKKQCKRYCADGNKVVSNPLKQCTQASDCGVGNTCAIENWGDETQACVQDATGGAPGFFVFTHIYRCASTATACRFTPRVQVLDNWGWCNGSCEKQADGTDRGCLNNPKVTLACDTDDRAWTAFDGAIILRP